MIADPLLRKTPLTALSAFDSNLPRFGNSVFFTVTENKPNIRFNNMVKMIHQPAYWAVTVWFYDKVKHIAYDLEWMFNCLICYNDVTPFVSRVLGGLIHLECPHLVADDLSGETWTAEILVRRLTVKEMEKYKEYDISFDPLVKGEYDFEIRYHDASPLEETIVLNPEKPTFKESIKYRNTSRKYRS